MGTYNLHRFSNPDALKAISPEHFLAIISSYRAFFIARGVALPVPGSADEIDYEGLVRILMTPDSDTPKDLADALYFVHEMATAEGMDDLLHEAEKNAISLDCGPNPTPADVAVRMWLKARSVLERKHAEQFLTQPRSFEYFQTDRSPLPHFKKPTKKALEALEEDLDSWFESKKRGRGARVFVYPKQNAVWFLVRHGEPFKREGSLDGGRSSSVFYRPEKHDVLVYEPFIGELRMNATSKGEKELYRKKFGLHLFGDQSFFPGTSKYTLEPLRTRGALSLVCTDVDGMEWVRLKEIRYFWGGVENEVEIRRADDIFAALEARGRTIPTKAAIIRASFAVKFTDSKTPRTVCIRPSNIAQYIRDDDSTLVEDWLTKRGFVVAEEEKEYEDIDITSKVASS